MCIWYVFCLSRCWTSCSGKEAEVKQLVRSIHTFSLCVFLCLFMQVQSESLYYLGQYSETRVWLGALLHNINSFLVVLNETSVKTDLVDLREWNNWLNGERKGGRAGEHSPNLNILKWLMCFVFLSCNISLRCLQCNILNISVCCIADMKCH